MSLKLKYDRKIVQEEENSPRYEVNVCDVRLREQLSSEGGNSQERESSLGHRI